MTDSYALVLPVSGSVSTTTKQKIALPRSVVTKLTIYFPLGHKGLTRVWINYQARRVIPNSLLNNYRGDNINFTLEPDLVLNESPYDLEFEGWNEDTIYPHTVYFSWDIDTLDSRIVGGSNAIARLIEAFGSKSQ